MLKNVKLYILTMVHLPVMLFVPLESFQQGRMHGLSFVAFESMVYKLLNFKVFNN